MQTVDFTQQLIDFERSVQAQLHKVFCPVHLCLGQEIVAAALHECLQPQDWLYAYHRSHGHYMAKGGNMQALMAEIMGEPSGINGGFSGSQEISDQTVNFHASAIVGGLVGVATGTALAMQLGASTQAAGASPPIVVCVFGDATVEQGVFWESINFAVLKQLPIAYICENNDLAVDSRIEERQSGPIARRVAGFGINMRWNVIEAIMCAREGRPTFCEMQVTRECDHINMATMPVGSNGAL